MTTALVPALQSNWLVMQTVMMLSYGALLAGCLLAICYLIVAFTSFKFSSNGKYERENSKIAKTNNKLQQQMN
jgi:ABC-type transport system involved in cytochrome c biogenesis permease subunit